MEIRRDQPGDEGSAGDNDIRELARPPLSKLFFLLLILSLGFMRPAVRYPLVGTDLIFLMGGALFAIEHARQRTKFRWQMSDGILLAYWLALSASFIVSPDIGRTMLKSAETLYLVGLAWLASRLVETKDDLRRVVLAWLASSAMVALIGLASLLAFFVAPDSWLVEVTRFHFGTLPPGNYPRLALTFFNANMACNYLSVSLGLLLVARHCRWVSHLLFSILLCGILLAALASISPGLGGIALLGGLWLRLRLRSDRPALSWLALIAGIGSAAVSVVALAVTPILHPTAPFFIHLPGDVVLAPAGRFLTWSAAVREWSQHPLLGHGLGVDAVSVRYQDPSGNLQHLTDAHNSLLNIAAQSGWIGVTAFAALVGYVALLMRRHGWREHGGMLPFGIGLIYLVAFVYQGIGGSFEDARHLWALLGLLFAADRIQSRAVARRAVSS